jgi:hypothetical protein
MDDLPSHVYFDMNLKNYSDVNDSKQAIKFSETRQSSIIQDCSQYDLSIVKFHLNTSSIPVYEAEIEPGSSQTDPNKMLHTITMEVRRGNAGSTIYCTSPYHLQWFSQDLSVPVPSPPSLNQDRFYLQSVSDYYFCYNYEHFCRIINNALKALTTSLSSFDPYFTDIPSPFMVYDHNNNKFCIIAKQNVFSTDRVFPSPQGDKEIYINIYFNRSLYNLFSTFYFEKQDPNMYQSYLNQSYNALKMHYRMIIDSFNDTNILLVSNTNIQPLNRYVQIYQMSSTIGIINCCTSILFCSNMLPILPSHASKPNLLFNNAVINYSKSGLQDSTVNVISDFSPGSDLVIRSDISYLPTAEYRMISLVNNKQDIRSVDMSVYWTNGFGIMRPVYLNSGASCSLKILFKRKY